MPEANEILELLARSQAGLRALTQRATRMRAYLEDVLDAAEAEDALAEINERGAVPLEQLTGKGLRNPGSSRAQPTGLRNAR